MSELKFHSFGNYQTFKGIRFNKLNISYQVFGKEIATAPVVLVNHSLTGNSDLNSDDKGWWKNIIGDDKLIDTKKYTVIAFNIPGNGYDNVFIENYKNFIAKDIARIFYLVLKELNIKSLYACIGGSIGGGIAWEMAALYPDYIKYLIPIASNWKSSDWVIGQCAVQESILLNSKQPLQDARKMAMLLYRTPESFTKKFNRTKHHRKDLFNVESWLDHHGSKLEKRFQVNAYLMMNHLLKTIDISQGNKPVEDIFKSIKSKIVQVSVSTDLFFVRNDIIKTRDCLDNLKIENEYYEIESIDGHDAFLIEDEQLTRLLKHLF